MSEQDPAGNGGSRRRKRFLSPSQKYELLLGVSVAFVRVRKPLQNGTFLIEPDTTVSARLGLLCSQNVRSWGGRWQRRWCLRHGFRPSRLVGNIHRLSPTILLGSLSA